MPFQIIANRLAKLMPYLIYPSQAGFTQGCSASSNIRKDITALEQAKANTEGKFCHNFTRGGKGF